MRLQGSCDRPLKLSERSLMFPFLISALERFSILVRIHLRVSHWRIMTVQLLIDISASRAPVATIPASITMLETEVDIGSQKTLLIAAVESLATEAIRPKAS